MGHRLVLDGVDLSALFPALNYYVAWDITDGGQGGHMLDGSDRVDELGFFTSLRIPCYPLTEGQLTDLYTRLLTPTHTVIFYDPMYGRERTITAKRSLPAVRPRGKGPTGDEYWTGAAIVLREVSPK